MHFQGIWHLSTSPLALVIRTIGVYLAMLVGFRIFGKRELGQATIFDLAMVLLIANAVQNAMVGSDTSLLGGLLVAMVLLILNAIVASLQVHDRWFRRILEGQPTVLISQGNWNNHAMAREGLDRGEVRAAMRDSGVIKAKEVRLAVLEADGKITVVPFDSHTVTVDRRNRQNRSKQPTDTGGRR